MDYNYHDFQTQRALKLFRQNMEKHEEGTKEYELSRKGFAYVANRVRMNEKLERQISL